jgi:hypothetical protein
MNMAKFTGSDDGFAHFSSVKFDVIPPLAELELELQVSVTEPAAAGPDPGLTTKLDDQVCDPL